MIDKKLILKLKKKTGLGILNCKKALQEAKGDFQKAITLLVQKSKHLAHKKLEKSIDQGMVFTKINPQKDTGILMALGCETDFGTSSEIFLQLAHEILDTALTHKIPHKSSLLATKMPNGNTVQEQIIQQIAALGENISIEEFHLLEAPLVASYIHTGNKLGAIAALNQAATTASIQEAAKDIALHIVAMNPLAIDQKGIAPELLAQQQASIREDLEKENKPPHIKERIAEGKLKKFITAHTLLHQPFVKDETMTCQTYLHQASPGLSPIHFKRIAIDG